MDFMYLPALALFAQEPSTEGPPLWTSFLPLVLMFALFYFLIILPNQRREKKQRELLYNTLKKNDKVLTQAGIIGVVLNIDNEKDEVTLRLDEGKLRILRSSIVKIFNGAEVPQDAIKKA